MTGSAARNMNAAYWDEVVGDWLEGRTPHHERPELPRWLGPYSGTGRGAVSALDEEFGWSRIAELDCSTFGAPWSRLADALRLTEQRVMIPLTVPSR